MPILLATDHVALGQQIELTSLQTPIRAQGMRSGTRIVLGAQQRTPSSLRDVDAEDAPLMSLARLFELKTGATAPGSIRVTTVPGQAANTVAFASPDLLEGQSVQLVTPTGELRVTGLLV